MRILIVEDDQRLTRLMVRVLVEDNHTVDVAHDGNSGLELALSGSYDVALPLALLLLTARGQVEDRVAGLDSGADDYLVKPFAFDELLARVRALGRRFMPLLGDVWELRCGSLVIDLRTHLARRDEQPLELTATEWRLLEFLLRHPGQTVTRQQILDYVWSYERDVLQTQVDVYVSYLRRKLALRGRPDPVHTVRGVGYSLAPEDA